MYQLAIGGVIRLVDGAFIPATELNRDWREYQAWLAAGQTPKPLANDPVVPQESPTGGFRVALIRKGIKDQVDAVIRATNDAELIELWEYATSFRRQDARVISIARAVGLNDAELDQLFIDANKV